MIRRVLPAVVCVTAALALAGCAGGSGGDDGGITDYWPAPTTSSMTSMTSTVVEAPSTTPVLPPPYIASATWAQTEVGPSLQIAPTQNGRDVSSPTSGDEAWAEVLRLDPAADTPGMKDQFLCHWTYARLVQPNKPTWNIEPDRPVVSPDEMVRTRCNPGFAEE